MFDSDSVLSKKIYRLFAIQGKQPYICRPFNK
jgi:hypothetical protein